MERFRKKAPEETIDDEPVVDEAVDVETEESDAPAGDEGWQGKLRTQLPFLAKLIPAKKGTTSVGERTAVGIQAPGAPAGQKQKIIRIVVGLGLAYLLYDTLMPSPEPAVEEAPVAEVKKPKRRRRPVEAPATEAPAAATDATLAATPEPTPEATSGGLLSDVDLAPVEATSPDVPATETPVPTDVPPTDEAITDAPLETPPTESATTTDTTGSTSVGETSPPEPEAAGSGETESKDLVTDGPAPVGEDMTDKILQDLEAKVKSEQGRTQTKGGAYVAPPTYDHPGRGLVYNCLGKHWACVDGGSYQVCQQNYRALNGQQKSKECFADSVYETAEGCAWVQRQKVSHMSSTEFCK